MTFAEILVVLIVGALLFAGLKPLRKKLEDRFYRVLGKGKKRVIDVTPKRKE